MDDHSHRLATDHSDSDQTRSSHKRAATPKKIPPSIPAAGTAYEPAAPLPVLAAALPVAVPVVPSEEVKLPMASVAEVRNEVASA